MNNLENNISDISNNHYKYLMNLENVNGVGLSYKYINNKNTFEPCLCVLVKNKINSKFLSLNNIIPKRYMGIKTDVIRVRKPSIENNILKSVPFKVRPLEAGCVISRTSLSMHGTICCIVKRNVERLSKKIIRYYILSNNHILANFNNGVIGTLFLQPGYAQNAKAPNDTVAILDNFIPVHFKEENVTLENFVDAAIARIIDPSIISNKIYSQGEIKGIFKSLTNNNLLMPVKKVGYKTGLTFGDIQIINATTSIEFASDKNAIFKNLIVSKIKTAAGDSGSAILTKDNEIVGMHMAGGGGYSYANDINTVLKKLNVKLYIG